MGIGPPRTGPVELKQEAEKYYKKGQYVESARLLRQALITWPDHAELYTSLGAVLHALGQLGEAEQELKRGLELDRHSPTAHDNLGVVLRLLGRNNEAIGFHQRAVKLDPESAQAHANYALALEQAEKITEAEQVYREAMQLDDSLVGVLNGLARIHRSRADFAETERLFRKALKFDPNRLTTITGLADVLLHTGRHKAALRLHRKAVRLAPENLHLHFLLASALSTASRDHEALGVYRNLERAGAEGLPILFGKAAALSNLGRYPAADKLYKKAFMLDPKSPVRSSYFFTLHASALKSDKIMLQELRKWEQYHSAPVIKQFKHHLHNRNPDRPLRIGYISPDFRQHVVRQFFEPVVRVHDSDNFQIYCYAEGANSDFATEGLRAITDNWYRTDGVSDEDVAKQIYRDGIDILIDLAGHTANNRLGVMTYRPAPVQATYLGYFGSTGLSSIDYWITDDVLHPADSTEPATETIYRLPRCGFCYGVPGHASLKVRDVHEEKGVIFGCYNNVSKVSLKVVDAWAEILKRCVNSRLILKDRRFEFASVRRTWRSRFERRGISAGRIDLRPNSPHTEYMQAYNDVDIALDPFPRTGGTTTCDALWMGVPVVTLAGERYVERLSATKLTAVGVTELIAGSVEEYINKAVGLAADRTKLEQYHRMLRSSMSQSPLCDPLSLANALEDTYRKFWHRYLEKTKA